MPLLRHKKLVTAGCSFTVGQGLADPPAQSWPTLLADKLNLECVNLAEKGAGNEYISNSVLEYSLNHSTRDCFFILAYSEYVRIDFCKRSDKNTRIHLTPHSTRWPNIRDAIYPEFVNDEYFFKKFLLNIIKMQSYFKLNNIDYMMVSAITEVDPKFYQQSDIRNLINCIDINKYKNFDEINFNAIIFPDGMQPDGHPNEIGHQKIADTLKDWILESNT